MQLPAFANVVAPAIARIAAIKTFKVTNVAAWECKTSTSQVRSLYLDFINSSKASSVTQGETSSDHPPWAALFAPRINEGVLGCALHDRACQDGVLNWSSPQKEAQDGSKDKAGINDGGPLAEPSSATTVCTPWALRPVQRVRVPKRWVSQHQRRGIGMRTSLRCPGLPPPPPMLARVNLLQAD